MVAATAGEIPVDQTALAHMNHFEARSVVVTGAGGSIGSELCEQLVRLGVRRLTLVSLTESGLYRIERRMRAAIGSRKTEVVPVLGSVGDRSLMSETLSGADIVIHAAAHKHVPICEANPLVAIENNVGGTYTLAQVAANAHVDQFVLISTDKAVRPASVMGATKRVAELVMQDRVAEYFPRTSFITVRFGNVLGSDGSVVPLWREQIAKGGPLTITDERCERYFMTIPEAVELVLGTAAQRPKGGTFVFDMGKPKRLIDLARELIENETDRRNNQFGPMASQFGYIDIKVIGLRPGEKVTEELHYDGEVRKTAHPKILQVLEERPRLDPSALLKLLGAARNRDRDAAVHVLRRMAAA